jgi:4-hydroxybenzoate polyprenyltransferase
MPPIRFKRVTFFSKLTISINSLLLLYSGIYLINESHVTEIPIGLILYFLILLTAAINFIDIKDYRGDKHANIKTLPVILGLKKSKFIIGLFFFISSLGIYFLLNETLLIIPLLILGMFQFFLINRTKYNEKHILITNNISLVLLIIYLLL